MAGRNFKVRVFAHDRGASEAGAEDRTLALTIRASNEDLARNVARAQLEQAGHAVLGIAHSTDDTLIARVLRNKAPKKASIVSGGVK